MDMFQLLLISSFQIVHCPQRRVYFLAVGHDDTWVRKTKAYTHRKAHSNRAKAKNFFWCLSLIIWSLLLVIWSFALLPSLNRPLHLILLTCYPRKTDRHFPLISSLFLNLRSFLLTIQNVLWKKIHRRSNNCDSDYYHQRKKIDRYLCIFFPALWIVLQYLGKKESIFVKSC